MKYYCSDSKKGLDCVYLQPENEKPEYNNKISRLKKKYQHGHSMNLKGHNMFKRMKLFKYFDHLLMEYNDIKILNQIKNTKW